MQRFLSMDDSTHKSLDTLYVEDDEALASVTKRALEKHGLRICHCSDIDSALQALQDNCFDRALLDLKIGQDTSLQLLAELKKHNPDILAVLLTGYGSIATAVQAMKLGAHNYLAKPVSADEILAAFRQDAGQGAEAEKNGVAAPAPSLRQIEWESIQRALQENDGNISATARQLKMHRRTLQRKLQKKQQP